MKKIILSIFIFGTFVITGCSSAQTRLTRFGNNLTGNSAIIKCYSGDTLIYEGTSKGKVSSEQYSDGYLFIDDFTDKLVEVSANCVIKYD